MDIWADPVDSNAEYDVTSYIRLAFFEVEETAENSASYGFGSNFSDAAFCLAQPIGGVLDLKQCIERLPAVFQG